MSKQRDEFLAVLTESIENGDLSTDCRNSEVADIAIEAGWSGVPLWFRSDDSPYKVGRGRYDLSSLVGGSAPAPKATKVAPKAKSAPAAPAPAPAAILSQSLVSSESTIPAKDSDYIAWGHHADVRTIIKSGRFYPVFVTGLSGNGKTTMIQQACAEAKRECYRVNITSQTDEDDLLGGFRLVNGETVWYDGPVIQAMKRGAVLLLDEIDLGSSPLMCLQPVLEGRGIFLKKINQFIEPAPGFIVFATANTKGKGDDTGAFAHTGILNEAFLDRFPVTLEQDYAGRAIEKKIILKKMNTLGCEDADFAENLVRWADAIRKTFLEGGVNEIITTRRLRSIVEAFSIFADKRKAIEMAISRFDAETKADFLRLYEKIDADVASGGDSFATTNSGDSAPVADPNACPF